MLSGLSLDQSRCIITGIILIGVGAKVKSNYATYDSALDGKYFSLPNLLIATGVIILLISFLGCYGAMKENWIMLMAFSVLLGVIFIFEFSAGIAGYVLRDKTSAYLEQELTRSMNLYTKDITTAIMWDTIQEEFECCGVKNFGDWEEQTFHNKSLPISCCPKKEGVIGVFYCNAEPMATTVPTGKDDTTPSTTPKPSTTPTPSTPSTLSTESPTKKNETESRQRRDIAGDAPTTTQYPGTSTSPYPRGCEAAFGSFVKAHAVDIGGLCFALAVIQLIGIGFAFHLARQVKNGYYST
ncbi:unnamed protein product [Acanthoscelides obtectus]|uniref:Tetraspanin n=1 Tax=Acanthoscelides obtectus TaxID=200917 RepID=A0A9P0P272_ACAOB|nr:unnamed protein product [Acanthoscelides obtectus]CAK1623465.1 CD63 antigen [Acanthoscelides obtectus]